MNTEAQMLDAPPLLWPPLASWEMPYLMQVIYIFPQDEWVSNQPQANETKGKTLNIWIIQTGQLTSNAQEPMPHKKSGASYSHTHKMQSLKGCSNSLFLI